MNAERLAQIKDLHNHYKLDSDTIDEILAWLDRVLLDNALLRVDLMGAKTELAKERGMTQVIAHEISEHYACEGT